MPTNPAMKMENIRKVLIEMGFQNVASVIASGNLLFDAAKGRKFARQKWQSEIEETIFNKLGFRSLVIIRTKAELLELVNLNPFNGIVQSKQAVANVTFMAEKLTEDSPLPQPLEDKGYKILGNFNGDLCFTVDTTAIKTPVVMNLIERTYNKRVSTRTWKTVERVLNKLAD